MSQNKNSKTTIATSIVCATVAIVAIVGGMIYMQRQDHAQKNEELQQQKQLTEFEQRQINERHDREKGGTSVDPCDKYSTC
jgi:uncharacterized protein HemX